MNNGLCEDDIYSAYPHFLFRWHLFPRYNEPIDGIYECASVFPETKRVMILNNTPIAQGVKLYGFMMEGKLYIKPGLTVLCFCSQLWHDYVRSIPIAGGRGPPFLEAERRDLYERNVVYKNNKQLLCFILLPFHSPRGLKNLTEISRPPVSKAYFKILARQNRHCSYNIYSCCDCNHADSN